MQTNSRLLDELLTDLGKLQDSRREEGKRHQLEFVLLIVILATMSGYLGYRAIEDFLEKHEAQLVEMFQPEKERIPSYSTVRRVLMKISFIEFRDIYKSWLAKYRAKESTIAPDNWCGVDGKALRGTIDSDPNDYVHLVSIFSTFEKVVLDTGQVESKSNEIPLVQQMIKESDLAGVIFTLDALHCQKKTTKIIKDTGNDYTIGVKENQPILLRQIKLNMENSDPLSEDTTIEKNRGRIETRTVTVYNNLEGMRPDWKGLKRIVKVERGANHIKAAKHTAETAYFISSATECAREFNRGIRGHWHIENSLHWTKDVVFKEDASKIKAGNAPENISLIKSMVMTVFRKNDFTSMTKAIRVVANDLPLMVSLLAC